MLQKAMISEIDIELITLNQAIRDHFAWANKLIEFSLFDDRMDNSFTDPKSHEICAFGHWLRLQLTSSEENTAALLAIEATHEIMHDAMREVIHCIGNPRALREKLNNYFHAQIHFLEATDRYKTELISLRNCYDTLTGLPLRQLLYKDFSRIANLRHLKGSTFYLSLIDIDYFKAVNDTWGHNVGDIILKELGQLLASNVRMVDRCYRFGGEEFIVLQECQNYSDFTAVMLRIMNIVRTHDFIIPGKAIKITVTCGTTTVREGDELQAIIDRADKAMYFGKQNGRNQCRLWSENNMIDIEKSATILAR
ncbi:diguanylate cyclase [Atlantibacter subterranea]|uniref:diguanylate cyclase n=1 Tax=Atlantibacter subterraneus TaxID=255519 RepID=UPI00118459E2|nr:diguanylate cyclase [Atlantibacter subterranea]TSJ59832.1 diguanylate cyclase [Atlantibacter subterranea]